jgi:hypothetical protein
MARQNLLLIDGDYATIAIADPFDGFREIVTTRLRPGGYVRIDDKRNYRQLCEGARTSGPTLIYGGDESFARDCDARLYKTRKGYEAAKAKHSEDCWLDRRA